MNLWPIEHFFEHIFHHFWVGLLLHLMDPPILMTNMLKKVFNWSEVHLSDVTCYKIHTLDTLTHWMRSLTSKKLNIVKRTSLGKSSNCSSDIFDDWEFKSLTWNISTFQLFRWGLRLALTAPVCSVVTSEYQIKFFLSAGNSRRVFLVKCFLEQELITKDL